MELQSLTQLLTDTKVCIRRLTRQGAVGPSRGQCSWPGLTVQQPLRLPASSPLLERTPLASSSTFPAFTARIYTSQRLSLLLEAVHVLTGEVAEDESLLPSPLTKVHPAVSASAF